MNHPEHGWHNMGAAPGSDPTAGATAAPTGNMGPSLGPDPMSGYGYGAPGAWPHHPPMGWQGGPAAPSYPPPGYGMGPPPHGYGPYGPAGYGGAPYGHAAPGSAPGPTPPGADSAGFGAAMGNLADQAGLGMFKDFFRFDDGEFWKGAMVGAAVVLLLTNEGLRDALIGGAAKTAEAVKSGMGNLAGSERESDAADQPSDPEDPSQAQPEDLPR
jgi:hypothetical protein